MDSRKKTPRLKVPEGDGNIALLIRERFRDRKKRGPPSPRFAAKIFAKMCKILFDEVAGRNMLLSR
jgi:hypothetical protein